MGGLPPGRGRGAVERGDDPYVADQLAMARLKRATYALMVSLLPATAAVIGVLVLAQIPSRAEMAGVALVVAGVALHRELQGENRFPTGGDRGQGAPG